MKKVLIILMSIFSIVLFAKDKNSMINKLQNLRTTTIEEKYTNGNIKDMKEYKDKELIKWSQFNEDGKKEIDFIYEKEKPIKVINYYPSGKISYIINRKFNEEKILEEEHIGYFENGNKKFEYIYDENNKEKYNIEYDLQGNKK